MSDAVSIKRRKKSESDIDFYSLRSEAIKIAQQVSGKVWTDYNLHDPGVTILEQIIYAITDLLYRNEFSVADYLVNESGAIDFNYHALHTPVDIFPCRATTIQDYRKIFLNAVNEIDNVWVTPLNDGEKDDAYQGLYKISVKLGFGISNYENDDILNKIRAVYNQTRNLCEDIGELTFVENIEYELCANIEMRGTRRPSDILAEIYFKCSQGISDSVDIKNIDQTSNQTEVLDELLDGPFTDHGFFQDDDFNENRNEFLVASLFTIINSIDGVDSIQQLYLKKGDKVFYDVVLIDEPDKALSILIPNTIEDLNIVLKNNGREMPVTINEVCSKLDEKVFMHRLDRATPQDLTKLYELPTGVARGLNQYTSFQNQFPSIYGVNQFGVPESAPTEVKAKSKQLKAYLIIFEQILTNYLSNLGSINTLFSIDAEQRSSYSFNLLDEQQIRDLNLLYPDNAFDVFKDIITRFDNYSDRKGRLLDYLLALYGESFTQNSLRHFNYYYDKSEIEDTVVNYKIKYLKSVVELGRDRASAANYTAEKWSEHARSGVQLRTSMLLGFEVLSARSLTMAIVKHGFKLTKHSKYEYLKADSPELTIINLDKIDKVDRDSFKAIPPVILAKDISIRELRKYILDAIPLKNNLISDVLLRGGISLDRYKVGSLNESEDYQLIFKIYDGQYWYLGTYSNRKTAIYAANALRQLFILLNKESEGVHIIEHVLLRPEEKWDFTSNNIEKKDDFFSLRVSVIFPSWTARCYNEQFRKLAEETVLINLPSHIYPNFYWFDFREMYEFETIYEKWMKLKSDPTSNTTELNECAQKIIVFLNDNQTTQKSDH